MDNLPSVPKPPSSFFQKYRFFVFFASLFLVFISVFLVDKLDQRKTKSEILPFVPQSIIKDNADEFEIPAGTSNTKKILLKYNGSEDDHIYVKGLSLDNKWLAFNLMGKDLEIVNLNTKARHQLPYDKGYWEVVVWRPDNTSFYATAENDLPEAGGGADALYLVSFQGLGNSSFSFEKKFLSWSAIGLVGLSPNKEKLALLDEKDQSLQILTVADGEIDSYAKGEVISRNANLVSWSPDSSKIVYRLENSIKILDLGNNKTSVLVPGEKPKTGYSEIITASSAWSVNGDKLAVYYERRIDTGDPFDGQWDDNFYLDIFNFNGEVIQKRRLDFEHSRTYLLWENDSLYFCPWEAQKLWVSYRENSIIYKSGFLIVEDQLNNFVKEYCQHSDDL